jgi:hypothetical protein
VASHDWWSALGYAKRHNLRNTSEQWLARFGRIASRIAEQVGKGPHHRVELAADDGGTIADVDQTNGLRHGP